jgi:hypothetical protein
MIGITRDGIREHFYDSEREDYFYKDTGERVPDKLREGFYTTVFRRSSRRRVEDETPEQRQQREERYVAFKIEMKAKYGRN